VGSASEPGVLALIELGLCTLWGSVSEPGVLALFELGLIPSLGGRGGWFTRCWVGWFTLARVGWFTLARVGWFTLCRGGLNSAATPFSRVGLGWATPS
jgi:hypothetical protein